jgi:Ribosomal subunit 39S
MRLTGVHIPDPAINSIRTVKSLLVHLVKPPKPKKLVEALVKKRDLVSLPNVKIFDRRVTPIDRERSVGRWKIIEKALEAKGLPVTGH